MTLHHVPWHRPMDGRDPGEENRTASPLELLFDLGFVVAVAASALALHHDLIEGVGSGLVNYLMVFFAIWWGWVNYSWFASAYDTGDVIFRLATFVVIVGALVLTAGIPTAAGHDRDYHLIVAGYLVMRLAIVPLWLRVSREHPSRRPVALRYAAGISLLQVCWVGWAWTFDHGGALAVVLFVVLAAAELTLPYVAESAGPSTPWHPDHIAERYQLFTIIVLGGVILAVTQALSASIDANGISVDLVLVVAAGLLIVFSLWWLYFKRSMAASLKRQVAFWFGYAHYFVLAGVAAAGASLSAMVEQVESTDHVSPMTTVLLLSGSVATYLLGVASVHALADRRWAMMRSAVLLSVLVVLVGLVGTWLFDRIGFSAMLVALVVVGAVVHHQLAGEGRGVLFPEEQSRS
ncbi:MAG TPA: low temperature requirement protein A [Marmoricola sp.]|nr:low temperature requirement protein A [Marmoricola sp.]